MQITLTIPEEFATQIIPPGKDPAQAALEALAIEGYRTQRLSESEVRRMLAYNTRMHVHALLAEHNVCLHYSLVDLDVDASTSRFLKSLREDEHKPVAG